MIIINTLASALILGSSAIWACGGEASGKHIGSVLKVGITSFTIRDVESNGPITFNATPDIMSEVKGATGGRIMVNYEEDEEGALNATGVVF